MSMHEDSLRLSVAVIARDAQDSLAETLEGCRGLADEVVVLDTGSVDGTCRVAVRHGAVLVRADWNDDFSAARNLCWSHVCGDWVLWLDAGERLRAEDAAPLRAFLEGSGDPAAAYMLLIRTPPAPGHVGGEQIAQPRLVPNNPRLRFRGRVREDLSESLASARIDTAGLPFRILRAEREHDPAVRAERARRNLRLADVAMKEVGPRPRLLNTIGDALAALGRGGQSESWHRRALASSSPASIDRLEAWYGLLAALESAPSARGDQLRVCLSALEEFPLDAQLLCALGGYLQSHGRLEQAARAYKTACKYGQVNPLTWTVVGVRELAACCHAALLSTLGQGERSLEFLAGVLEEFPQSAILQRQLVDLHVAAGMSHAAIELIDRLSEIDATEPLKTAVRGAILAGKENWSGALLLLESAYEEGCRDSLCLRWLAAALLAAGEKDRLAAVVEEWGHSDPGALDLARFRRMLAGGENESTAGALISEPADSVTCPLAVSVEEPAGPLPSRLVPAPHVPFRGLPFRRETV